MIQSAVSLNDHNEEIDISEAMRTLRRYWRKIAIFTLAGTVTAILYVLFATPQFAINGRLYLGDARSNAPAGAAAPDFSDLSNQQSVSDVDTQIELIKSKGLVEQAILQSGLNAQVKAADSPALLFWNWALLYHRNTDAFAPQPGDLRAVNAVFDNPPRGQISLDIVMGNNGHYQITEDGGWFAADTPVLSGSLGQPASGGGLSLVLEPAIDGAIPTSGSQFILKISSAETVADTLRASGNLDVLNGGVQNLNNPTKIADLLYTGADPYAGQLFLTQLMTNFVAAQTSWNDQAAAATDDFITGQLARIRTSLANANQKLADYQSQTGILDVPDTAKAVIDQLSQYETQRTSIQLQQEALQQLSTELSHPTGPLNPYLVSQTGDTVLTQLAGNLADAEVKLQSLQAQFTGSAPDVQVQQASVGTIETAIATLVNNDLTLASRNLQNIDGMIGQFNTQLKTMPAESLEVIALTRSSDTLGQIYQVLLQKQEDAEVSKAATVNNTRIVTPPELPLQAATPKPLITLAIGFFAGFFAGSAVILGQLMLSGRFHSDEEIRRLVPLPVYGLIPRDATIEATPKLLSANLQSPFSEALRLLRSNLYRSATGQGARVVLLTSADVDDGKTTISVNLAKMLADDGKRVILVDADLHVGRMHEALRVDPSHGLTQWLTTHAKPWFQSVPGQRFMMLPAGVLPPNPSELLNDPFFADIMATLRAEFEYVIIDSPPLPAVSDGIALGQQADIILSVVMIDHTVRRAFAVHSEMLSTLDRRQGIIINGVAANSYGYGYASKNAAPPTSGMMSRARKFLGLPS